MGTQTEVSLPQRVQAFWHCCPRDLTVVDVGEDEEEGSDDPRQEEEQAGKDDIHDDNNRGPTIHDVYNIGHAGSDDEKKEEE